MHYFSGTRKSIVWTLFCLEYLAEVRSFHLSVLTLPRAHPHASMLGTHPHGHSVYLIPPPKIPDKKESQTMFCANYNLTATHFLCGE